LKCHIITNGNKLLLSKITKHTKMALSLYRDLESLFGLFGGIFCFQGLPKWHFLVTSKLPKMANQHSSTNSAWSR